MQSQELGLHHHVNLLYDAPCEVLRETAPYVAQGLAANELCVYVTDDDVTPTSLRNALQRRAGVDVEAKERDGQLLVLTYEDAYLKGGTFDKERMLDTWRQLLSLALSKGLHGVRVVGGTNWGLHAPSYLQDLLRYEAEVDKLFATHPFGAICSYNRAHLSLSDTLQALATHPITLLDHASTMECPRSSWDLSPLLRFVNGFDEYAAVLHTIEVRNTRDIIAARETIRVLATAVGLTRVETTSLLAAASELGRNALVHAGGGALAIGVTSPSGHMVLGAFDRGPGIHRVDLALKDGYSTIGSLGMGLPGTKRVMDRFEVCTELGLGTQVLAAKLRQHCQEPPFVHAGVLASA